MRPQLRQRLPRPFRRPGVMYFTRYGRRAHIFMNCSGLADVPDRNIRAGPMRLYCVEHHDGDIPFTRLEQARMKIIVTSKMARWEGTWDEMAWGEEPAPHFVGGTACIAGSPAVANTVTVDNFLSAPRGAFPCDSQQSAPPHTPRNLGSRPGDDAQEGDRLVPPASSGYMRRLRCAALARARPGCSAAPAWASPFLAMGLTMVASMAS